MQTTTHDPARIPLAWALMSLTFSTGLVDAVSYLGMDHIFVANMTGNIVFIGFSLANTPGLRLNGQVGSLLAFVLGALLGGRFGNLTADTARRRWLINTALVEAALLLAAALSAPRDVVRLGEYPARAFVVLILTALAMGWRTATIRKLAFQDVITTVLTLSLTGLAADSKLAGGNNPNALRRLLSLGLLTFGAITGALLLPMGAVVPLLVGAACALSAALAYSRLPKDKANPLSPARSGPA